MRSKSLSSGVEEPSKDSEKVDSSQPLQTEYCSQCQDTSHGLLQCKCCDLWYCGGCSGIPEQTVNVIGEVDSLHFFCSPCEVKILNWWISIMMTGQFLNILPVMYPQQLQWPLRKFKMLCKKHLLV